MWGKKKTLERCCYDLRLVCTLSPQQSLCKTCITHMTTEIYCQVFRSSTSWPHKAIWPIQLQINVFFSPLSILSLHFSHGECFFWCSLGACPGFRSEVLVQQGEWAEKLHTDHHGSDTLKNQTPFRHFISKMLHWDHEPVGKLICPDTVFSLQIS